MSMIWRPGFTFRKQAVSADPYYNNVSLLLHGDGANGSTTIIDSSPSPKTVTAAGNAQISTAQSVFGGSSILFDGSGDYLDTPYVSGFDIESGDFTVELRFRLSAIDKLQGVFATRGAENKGYVLRVNANNTLQFFFTNSTSITTSAFTVSPNLWYYVAVKRSSNNLEIWIDEELAAQSTSAQDGQVGSSIFRIGAAQTNTISSPLDGFVDDFRLTKGIARDVSVVPTAPFPEVLG